MGHGPVERWVDGPVGQLVDEPLDQWAGGSVHWWTDWSLGQWMWAGETVGRWASGCGLVKQWVDRPGDWAAGGKVGRLAVGRLVNGPLVGRSMNR